MTTTTYRPTTGTRTAELDPTTNTLTVFDGGTILTVIAITDDITPGQVWNLIATAQAPTAELVNGHAVEQVDISQVTKGDEIVTTHGTRQVFTTANADAFRTYTAVGNQVIRWGHYVMQVRGRFTNVQPGTTVRRALHPEAVRAERRAAHRSLMNELNRR